MTITSVCAVFAYGTLKRGQCREHCWPAEPLAVHKAWTAGELYDTGPYPALFSGSDRVAGELWIFSIDAIAAVLRELDAVEEFYPGHEATNLYNRRIVECTAQDGNVHRAHTYFYGQLDEKLAFTRVQPHRFWSGQAFVVWPEGSDW